MVKIIFVVTEIPFTVAVITCSVDKISLFMAKIAFVMAGITFKVAMITSSVAKINFVLAEITFKWLCSLLNAQDNLCSG